MEAAVGRKTAQAQEDVASVLQEVDTGSAEADSDDARGPEAGAWHSVPEASAAVGRARTQAEAADGYNEEGAGCAPEAEEPGEGDLGDTPAEGVEQDTGDTRSTKHNQIEQTGHIDNRCESQ